MPTRLFRAPVLFSFMSLTLIHAHGQTKDWIGPYPGLWDTRLRIGAPAECPV